MQHFLGSNSLLLGIFDDNFQRTHCSVDVVFPLNRLPEIRVVLISKQIFCAPVFLEQVEVFKIRFVCYIEYLNMFTVVQYIMNMSFLVISRDGTGQDFLDPTGKFQNHRRLTGPVDRVFYGRFLFTVQCI